MKHWMKRSLALLLCLVMLCAALPNFAARAEEIELIPIDEEPGEEIVIVGEEELAEEPAAQPNGDGTTTYRALLIGQTYNDVTLTSINPLYGDLSVGMMKTLLKGVNGGNGGSFTVTSKIDASYSDIYNMIDDLSYEADSDDVTFFYYNGHGVVTGDKDDAAGALVTVESDGGIYYVYTCELADWLDCVPGKIVVILDSCGAGACIANDGADAALFDELAVKAFAEKDEAVSNVGEMRNSKYYVLAAAPYDEYSWALGGIGGELTYALKAGAEGSMPADTDGDDVATLKELYTYIDSQVSDDQTTCVYPTSSSFKVFSKLDKPVITTQPKNTTICAGTDVSFKAVAEGATKYQWYYRTSSSGSWNKSTVSTATKATLKYTNVSIGHDGYQYRCKVSNANGYVYTKAATLTVQLAPVITTQPKNLTISAGDDASFTVKASGALSYQWYWRENSNDSWRKSTVSTATSATLKYSNLGTSKSGRQYRCRVANDKAYVYTNTVTLTVLGKPTITTQPSSASVSLDATAKFTVKASGATSYQWYYRTSSSGSWAKTSLTGNKTATLSVKATASRYGYQYRCKVSNDYGYVYSSAATLTIQSTAPIITSQPKDLTITAGGNASFTVKAVNALSYQWQWRKNSSDSWKDSTVSTATTATLKYSNLGADKTGRQYRCRVANDKAYTYTNIVTLTVEEESSTTYRALLVGEVNFSFETANRNRGDVTLIKNMLSSVKGPKGGKYTVTCKYDLSSSGLKSAIKSAFSGADDDDVSLFFIATHGVTDVASGVYAGELLLIGSDGSNEYMTISELATCLKAVPGKVIVLLGSCGSGAAIVSSGTGEVRFVEDTSGLSDDLFNEAVISAFAAADEIVSNTGELRNSKFYVLTAAAHQESSWGYEGSDPHNVFPYYFALGAGSGKPADANGNGTITLNEMYNYIYTKALSEVDQHTQVYPTNSSYALFK